MYRYSRKLRTVVWTLCASSLLATGAALLANRFVIFPVYAVVLGGDIFGMTVAEAFSAFWGALLIFNFIKTVSVALMTMALYKRLSNLFKKWKI